MCHQTSYIVILNNFHHNKVRFVSDVNSQTALRPIYYHLIIDEFVLDVQFLTLSLRPTLDVRIRRR